MNEIARKLDCPSRLRAVMDDYVKTPTHDNWVELNNAYKKHCPCEKSCGKCEVLKVIVRYVLKKK